jgi:hypothetical protein
MITLGRNRRGRVGLGSLLVTAIQLASVTWIPVIHPYLHHESPIVAASCSEARMPPTDLRALQHHHFCWACLASVGLPVPGDAGSVLQPVASSRSIHASPDRDAPPSQVSPANRVRAPPRH